MFNMASWRWAGLKQLPSPPTARRAPVRAVAPVPAVAPGPGPGISLYLLFLPLRRRHRRRLLRNRPGDLPPLGILVLARPLKDY